MLPEAETYETLTSVFAWQIPADYNMGVGAWDKWADGAGCLGLIYENRAGNETRYRFDELKTLSDRFANALLKHGVRRGDRVGIFLPQSPETAIAHLAIYKAGCIAVPLFALFGVDAIQYRLADSGAAAPVTDLAGLRQLAQIPDTLPELKEVFCIDYEAALPTPARPSWAVLHAQPDTFEPAPPSSDH